MGRGEGKGKEKWTRDEIEREERKQKGGAGGVRFNLKEVYKVRVQGDLSYMASAKKRALGQEEESTMERRKPKRSRQTNNLFY